MNTATDTQFQIRQQMVEPLGTLIHHIFAHSGVFEKLESPQANTERRQRVMADVAQRVHQSPAKEALDEFIQQLGEEKALSTLKLSHELYESLGEGQPETLDMMVRLGLDVQHLNNTKDISYMLENINKVAFASSPKRIEDYLQVRKTVRKMMDEEAEKEQVPEGKIKLSRTGSSRERERGKSRHDKLMDWVYTANHAIYCLITDIPDIFGKWALKELPWGKRINNAVYEPFMKYSGLNALKSTRIASVDDDGNYHQHPVSAKIEKALDKRFGEFDEEAVRTEWWGARIFNAENDKYKIGGLAREFLAELIGDSIAVPFTIFMQRNAPGLMNRLDKFGERIQGGMYRRSTRKEAIEWGKEHGYAISSKQVREKQQELYDYEVGHLSQGYMWTFSSIFFNAGASWIFGSKNSYGRLVSANVLSALTTLGVVNAFRIYRPKETKKIDSWTKRTFIDPIFGKKLEKEEKKQGTARYEKANQPKAEQASPLEAKPQEKPQEAAAPAVEKETAAKATNGLTEVLREEISKPSEAPAKETTKEALAAPAKQAEKEWANERVAPHMVRNAAPAYDMPAFA